MLLKQYAAIDLFCGAGGLTHGLRRAGVQVLAGIDSDPYCRHSFEENNKPAIFIHKDITEMKGAEIDGLFGDIRYRILVGCAPCQPFSSHTKKYRKGQNDSEPWNLLLEFSRLVKEAKPDIVSMENVTGLKRRRVFNRFISELEDMGYSISYKSVYGPDFGIPQTRYRLVLLASKLGLPIEMISTTYEKRTPRTVRDTIGHLPEIEDGEANFGDPLHRAPELRSLNKSRIRQSKPGGTWMDWDEKLRATCHLRESGRSYKSVYGRMEWDRPAPTLTTQFFNYGTGRYGHPEQDRALSLREGALLQTFPGTYSFVPDSCDISFDRIGRLIGNAVPVLLGEAIGKSIIKHIKEIEYV